jgi:hypothetical protein
VSYVAGEVIAASELITTQTVRLKKEWLLKYYKYKFKVLI